MFVIKGGAVDEFGSALDEFGRGFGSRSLEMSLEVILMRLMSLGVISLCVCEKWAKMSLEVILMSLMSLGVVSLCVCEEKWCV